MELNLAIREFSLKLSILTLPTRSRHREIQGETCEPTQLFLTKDLVDILTTNTSMVPQLQLNISQNFEQAPARHLVLPSEFPTDASQTANVATSVLVVTLALDAAILIMTIAWAFMMSSEIL